jgi:hypothetical protein
MPYSGLTGTCYVGNSELGFQFHAWHNFNPIQPGKNTVKYARLTSQILVGYNGILRHGATRLKRLLAEQ